jgi:hypothetical protein
LRTVILDTLSLSLLPGTQNRDILGSWLVAALEEGRRAGGTGLRSWEESTVWHGEGSESDGRIDLTPQLATLAEYLSLAILDPPSLDDDIHPSPVASTPAVPPPPPKGKGKGKQTYTPTPPTPAEPTQEETEHAEERWARYRVGGLVGLSWLLSQLKRAEVPLSKETSRLLHDSALWSCLSSLPSDEGSAAFGHQHSPVRRAAYTVLTVLVDAYPEEIAKEDILQTLAGEMLDAIWVEKEGTVWEAAGPAVAKILSSESGFMEYRQQLTVGHREIWSLSKSSSKSVPEDGQEADTTADEAGDDEDEDEANESEDDDDDDEGNGAAVDEDDQDDTGATATPHSADPKVTCIAFDRFLEFISTICPTIPHTVYPLLLVIVSTLPPTLLPLSGDLANLKTFFAHLWSPVDARLLSTHALPGQPSAFQAFLRDAVDCTTFLISKASKADDGAAAVEWLVKEQLGERVWKEGVLELGGRSLGRRAAQGARSEQEAMVFGQALARLALSSTPSATDLLDLVATSTIQAISSEEDSRRAVALLPRVLPIISAVRTVNENQTVKDRLDELVGQMASLCSRSLHHPEPSAAPTISVYVESLTDIIKSNPSLVPVSIREEVVQSLESSTAAIVAVLSPALYISLLNSLASTSEDDEKRLSGVLARLSRDTAVDRDTRFAITSCLLASSSSLISGEVIDHIAEEAAQTALADEGDSSGSVAAACVADCESTVTSMLVADISSPFPRLAAHDPRARQHSDS